MKNDVRHSEKFIFKDFTVIIYSPYPNQRHSTEEGVG